MDWIAPMLLLTIWGLLATCLVLMVTPNLSREKRQDDSKMGPGDDH